MTYPKAPDLDKLVADIQLLVQLKHEYGAKQLEPKLRKAERALKSALADLKRAPDCKRLAKQEPNGLRAIHALRPRGPRRLWDAFDGRAYKDRIAGALLGRAAGCTLGAPVEFWPVWNMENLAEENGEVFPPVDYWKAVPNPLHKRYQMSLRKEYTKTHMNGVPVDDDLAYTLLGLLVLEDHGPDFTIDDVGRAWVKYLPYACTAEDYALKNLWKGIPGRKAANGSLQCEWIGADIRSDPWGYLAPAWPERAAEMAYRDAYVSHRRNGIYGEMYFSAAIAAAFAVDDPIEALKIGLTEIPKDCATAKAVRWALRVAPKIGNYKQARNAMDRKFKGMHRVHTINNACLTVWGITIGGTDFTKVIGETVAMGMDNDCTAATAGSIVGAVIGKKGIPRHWYVKFNNVMRSYLIRRRTFAIDKLLKRFESQARKVWPS